MKQKIFISLIVFALLLVTSPVAAASQDLFLSVPDINLIRQRIEQRQNQARQRFCNQFLRLSLPSPGWCDQITPPPPPPPPPPAGVNDHLLITEVYYDADGEHGTEPGNEWVEIYNGTGQAIDLEDWMIADGSGFDLLPAGAVLNDNSFAIITSSASTAGFWNWPEDTLVIVLSGSIGGNGLANGGDAVFLKNSAEEIVDQVSYGGNTQAFDPSVADVDEGHSIMRLDIFSDTDTAADWADAEFPGPGGAA